MADLTKYWMEGPRFFERPQNKPFIPREGLSFAPSEVYLAADVDALLAAKDAEVERLQGKLHGNKCNRGHETLPLVLWDCPACHDETRAERDQFKRDLAAVRGELSLRIEMCVAAGERQEIMERDHRAALIQLDDVTDQRNTLRRDLSAVRGEHEYRVREVGELNIKLRDLQTDLEQAKAQLTIAVGTNVRLDHEWGIEKQRADRAKAELEAAKAQLQCTDNARATHQSESQNRLKRLVKCEQERDRAQADAAALVSRPRKYAEMLKHLGYKERADAFFEFAALVEAEPHPGQRYLELAQIVEGLPKVEGRGEIMVQENKGGDCFVVLFDAQSEHGNQIKWSSGLIANRELADALAKLLAWRKEQP